MLEQKLKTNANPTTPESGHSAVLAELRNFESREDRVQLLEQITSLIGNGIGPLSTKETLEIATSDYPDLKHILDLVLELDGNQDYEVHPIEDFEVIDEEYVGATGRTYHPSPKYVPKPMSRNLHSMQNAYKAWLEKHPQHVGPHGRPGLVVLSAYRSPYYQTALLAQGILRDGVETTLENTALASKSQHAKYDACGIDFTVIGDINGNRTMSDGYFLQFEDTVEFDWLLEAANDFGFWFPYAPQVDNPTGRMSSKDGIIVEPWHMQYIGNADAAYAESLDSEVVKAFRARKAGRMALSVAA